MFDINLMHLLSLQFEFKVNGVPFGTLSIVVLALKAILCYLVDSFNLVMFSMLLNRIFTMDKCYTSKQTMTDSAEQ